MNKKKEGETKMTKEKAQQIRDIYLEEVKTNPDYTLGDEIIRHIKDYLKDTLHLYILPLLFQDIVKDVELEENEFVGVGKVTHNRNNPNTYLSLVDCDTGDFKKSLFSTRDLANISEDIYYKNTKPRLDDHTAYVLVKYQISAQEWLGNTGSGAAKEWTKDLPVCVNGEEESVLKQFTSVEWNELITGKQEMINTALFSPDDQPDYLQFQAAVIQYVKDFISEEKFDYRGDVISRFIRALFTDQMILLSGAPGSGKTSLPREVAKVIGARCRMVEVKSGWSDESDLIGYYDNHYSRYMPTPFMEALHDAKEDPKHVYLICLDEMNLSQIEDYFSSVLYAMEQDKELRLYSKFTKEPDENFPPVFTIPSNVQLIGTLNIDETSERPNRKLIDRSYLIDVSWESEYEEEVGGGNADVDAELARLHTVADGINHLFKESGGRNDLPSGFDPGHIKLSVVFSKRGAGRARRMLEKGCSADDLLAGKVLPTLRCSVENKDELDIVYQAVSNLLATSGFPLSRARLESMYDGEKLDCWTIAY